VRNTPNVTGFIGAGTTPIPVSNQEIEYLQKRMGVDTPQFQIEVQEGDAVKVVDGPFKDFDGKVSETDEARGKVKVLINMFGRDTPVELDSLQIEKI
jgi:transcription termination/antitermination protein NusG